MNSMRAIGTLVQRAQRLEIGHAMAARWIPAWRSAPSGQPQAACAAAGSTPGYRRSASSSSRVCGWGRSTPKSVITCCGPAPGAPRALALVTTTEKAAARAKIDTLDETAARLAQHHEGLLRMRRDLGCTTGAGQPGTRTPVVTDHGAVEVAEAVDLRGAPGNRHRCARPAASTRRSPARARCSRRYRPARHRRWTAATPRGGCRWCPTRRSEPCAEHA